MAVQDGNYVEVDYTGRLTDGSVFDSSKEDIAKEADVYNSKREYEPLGFTVGEGEVIPGFEEGVKGMEVGKEKEVEIPPEDAYGKSGDHPLAGETLIFKIEVKNIE